MAQSKTRTLGLEDLKLAKTDESVTDEKTVKAEGAAVEEKPVKKVVEKKSGVKKVKGVKHVKAQKMVDVKKKYTLEDAVALVKKMKYASFDESVEIHMNVDKTGLKGEIELPHSTGKTVRVAIVSDTVLDELTNGKINFDILITHPSFMPKLAKFAKVLGPKGLMPNPKAGTVSPNPEEVAKKFQKGTMRWKTEGKFPLIHQMVGKVSFEDKMLVENIKAFIAVVGKPHITEAFVTSTMSPSVRLDLEKV
jgi:large subunit ribosomal protein L1